MLCVPRKVSIVPRSNGALGFAQYLPQEMSLFSKEVGHGACVVFFLRCCEGLVANLDIGLILANPANEVE